MAHSVRSGLGHPTAGSSAMAADRLPCPSMQLVEAEVKGFGESGDGQEGWHGDSPTLQASDRVDSDS